MTTFYSEDKVSRVNELALTRSHRCEGIFDDNGLGQKRGETWLSARYELEK
jgi:hypothetical protein